MRQIGWKSVKILANSAKKMYNFVARSKNLTLKILEKKIFADSA